MAPIGASSWEVIISHLAWYLESAPGALIRLGSALPDRRVDLHSTTFDLDERAIPVGIEVGAASLLRLLDTYRS